MKKLLFTLIACCMGALSAAAQENVTIDGINYYLYNDEATIMVQPETLSGNIIIPATVSHNGKEYEVVRIADNAFERTKITGIELPEGITKLGNSCFRVCMNLKSIILKGEVTTIGDDCFYYCDLLTSIDFLPKTVTSLGSSCFARCHDLRTVYLPNSITSIGNNCFEYCSDLTEAFLPASLKNVPNTCFAQSGLRSVTISNGVETLGIISFGLCKNLASITLPPSIKSITQLYTLLYKGFCIITGCHVTCHKLRFY